MEATDVRTDTRSDPAAPPARIPVSVVEDHPLYRDALTRLFQEAGDFDVDVVAGSVGKFMACRPRRDGIVVLDLTLPGIAGAAAVLQINGMGNRVLVVSAEAAKSDVLGAISAGARGFLSKESEGTEIVRAVREIAAGKTYVSPTLASIVLSTEQNRQAGPRLELSGQEKQVLRLVAEGKRDRDIAMEMSISVRTVRSYLDRIRDKIGARRRAEMTRAAIELGVLAESAAC